MNPTEKKRRVGSETKAAVGVGGSSSVPSQSTSIAAKTSSDGSPQTARQRVMAHFHLVSCVVDYLPQTEISSATSVSKHFKDICDQERFWKTLKLTLVMRTKAVSLARRARRHIQELELEDIGGGFPTLAVLDALGSPVPLQLRLLHLKRTRTHEMMLLKPEELLNWCSQAILPSAASRPAPLKIQMPGETNFLKPLLRLFAFNRKVVVNGADARHYDFHAKCRNGESQDHCLWDYGYPCKFCDHISCTCKLDRRDSDDGCFPVLCQHCDECSCSCCSACFPCMSCFRDFTCMDCFVGATADYQSCFKCHEIFCAGCWPTRLTFCSNPRCFFSVCARCLDAVNACCPTCKTSFDDFDDFE